MDSECITIKKLCKQWIYLYLSFNRGLNCIKNNLYRNIIYILLNLTILSLIITIDMKILLKLILLEISFYFCVFYYDVFLTSQLSYKSDLIKMFTCYLINILITYSKYLLGIQRGLLLTFALHLTYLVILINKNKRNNLFFKTLIA